MRQVLLLSLAILGVSCASTSDVKKLNERIEYVRLESSLNSCDTFGVMCSVMLFSAGKPELSSTLCKEAVVACGTKSAVEYSKVTSKQPPKELFQAVGRQYPDLIINGLRGESDPVRSDKQ